MTCSCSRSIFGKLCKSLSDIPNDQYRSTTTGECPDNVVIKNRLSHQVGTMTVLRTTKHETISVDEAYYIFILTIDLYIIETNLLMNSVKQKYMFNTAHYKHFYISLSIYTKRN